MINMDPTFGLRQIGQVGLAQFCKCQLLDTGPDCMPFAKVLSIVSYAIQEAVPGSTLQHS